MKGIVFNLLEQVVVDSHGIGAWEDVLDETALSGAYTAVGTYPDEELLALVDGVARLRGSERTDVVRWFGCEAIPLLTARYPQFFDPHPDTRSFVLTLNDVIHPEVRKLFPGAYAPEFEFEDLDDGRLVLGYRSHRGLCSFAEGLLEGAAAHYGEKVSIERPECALRGDPVCRLVCTFSGAA